MRRKRQDCGEEDGRMREKIVKNLGMKLLSLAIAIIVWIVIVNIDNPTVTKLFRDIPVEIINENVVKSKEKVYSVVEGSTVDILVKGRKSVLDYIKASDLRAVADLRNLTFTNAVPILPSCTKSNAVECSLGDIKTLKISLEDMSTKQFKVTPVQKGIPEDGYFIGSMKVKPNMIQVSGAKSQIAKIDQIRVDADVSNAMKDFTTTGKPKAYDADGRILDISGFTFSSKKVAVFCDILQTKQVSILLSPQNAPEREKILLEYEPKQITIAAETEILKKMNRIVIPIDLTKIEEKLETELNIVEYLPKNIQLADKTHSIVVRAQRQQKPQEQTKVISFSTDQIGIENLESNLQVQFEENQVEVAVSGLENKLKALSVEALKPILNCKGLNDGIQQVKLSFQKIDGVQIADVEVNVTLTKLNTPEDQVKQDTREKK